MCEFVNPRTLREKSIQLSGWTSRLKRRIFGGRTTRRIILISPANGSAHGMRNELYLRLKCLLTSPPVSEVVKSRFASENESVFTFLVQHLDRKWPNAAPKSYESCPASYSGLPQCVYVNVHRFGTVSY